ncbi:hypothetical protein [Mumia flava]|uniref:hypothetical protein n=1 Tax=Mumia flava TaxID=1348852 RepID=UPI0012FE6A80|nr:hypothetical protein [Mumia flava]
MTEAELSLTTDELRAVTRYATEDAEAVLRVFENDRPDDPRPREAVDAHRAAKETTVASATHASHGAGDAAAAAYLHPLARATQVAHILRASAHAALRTR